MTRLNRKYSSAVLNIQCTKCLAQDLVSAVPEIRPGVKTLWLKKRDCCDVYLLEEHHGWHAPMNLDINFIDSEKKKFTHICTCASEEKKSQ